MKAWQPNSEAARNVLRAYLLGTLDEAERGRVEGLLHDSPAWREALDAERRALAQLDVLSDEAPRRDLAAAVARRITAEAPARSPRQAAYRFARYAVVLLLVCSVLAFLLPALSRSREAALRASTANNMKQLGLVFRMYADENNGLYPPLAPYADIWVPDLRVLYPEYFTDPSILMYVNHPNGEALEKTLLEALSRQPIDWDAACHVMAKSYSYLGFVVHDGEEAAELPAMRAGQIRGEGKELQPFSESAAAAAGPASHVPVLIQNFGTMSSRKPAGSWVLFLDGSVEYIRKGTFPVTDSVAEALGEPMK